MDALGKLPADKIKKELDDTEKKMCGIRRSINLTSSPLT